MSNIKVTENGVTVTVIDGVGIGDGGDRHYRHVQSNASAVWTITHNLGKYPNVVAVDSAGDAVYGNIKYLSTSQLIITFSAAFSGEAYCN